MLNKYDTRFSVAYSETLLVGISDYALLLFIPSQLQKMTHCHQTMCGCKICIQDGTYQEYLNNLRK